MSLDIDGQQEPLELVLAWPLGQVRMHYSLAQRALDVEPELHMLGAPLVRLIGARDEAVARPPTPRRLAKCCDLGTFAEQLLAFGTCADGGCGAVEVCGFRGWGEDVTEEEIAYRALFICISFHPKVQGRELYGEDDADEHNA